MFDGPARLFGDYRIEIARTGSSRNGHTFGGPPDRTGASRDNSKGVLLHLLHRLNLRDPRIPFTIPGFAWVPLYYCFDFRVNELGYRLTSDESMEVYFPKRERNVSRDESWPYEDYPLQFPRAQIKLSGLKYDPTDLEDAFHWAGIFGIDKLSSRQQAAAKRRAAKDSELMTGVLPDSEAEFREALSLPFPQGRPIDLCLNPGCPNRRREGQLEVVAMIPGEPVKGMHIFGPDFDHVIVIVLKCPKCNAFRVSNQM